MTHKEQNDIALARIVEQLDLLGQLQREVAADRAGRTALIDPVYNQSRRRRPKYEPREIAKVMPSRASHLLTVSLAQD
ncbi:MAG: hypothetical protein QOH31_540 [Verrucomicrobiota bacterium]